MNITQDMYNVTLQQHRNLYVKVNLLNFQFLVVNEISGYTTEMPNITEDANSDIRRTCDIKMCIQDGDFNIKKGGQIFLDKYIQLYIGIENNRNDEIVWFNEGIYLINQPNYDYDAVTNSLSFQGVDLMAKLTGMRNGNLEGITYIIPSGSDIRGAVISALNEGGFNKYIININEGQELTPYEIKIESGGTIYNILTQLRDIYCTYQIYFDLDGVFHFEPIPSGQNEISIVDDNIWKNLLIKVSKSVDFEDVKNVIEVWGKETNSEHYHALVKDENPDSPFYVNGSVGEIRIVLSGGEYDNISSQQLAQDRAEYELYLRARLNDNITIDCVPIYFLETNKLITITLPNEDESKQYIIQSISTGGTQSITASRYYPLYPILD